MNKVLFFIAWLICISVVQAAPRVGLQAEEESMIVHSESLAPEEVGSLAINPEDIHRARLVIVINKSSKGESAQTLRVYLDGEPVADAYGQTAWPISTGREKTETAKNGDVYRTTTPVGYFRPTHLVTLHVSKKWKAEMPHSVFFIGGIAIHGTGVTDQLGKRASGGCVRTDKANAKKLFNLVRSTAGATVQKINRDGSDALNKDGTPARIKAYDTLIIVENPA